MASARSPTRTPPHRSPSNRSDASSPARQSKSCQASTFSQPCHSGGVRPASRLSDHRTALDPVPVTCPQGQVDHAAARTAGCLSGLQIEEIVRRHRCSALFVDGDLENSSSTCIPIFRATTLTGARRCRSEPRSRILKRLLTGTVPASSPAMPPTVRHRRARRRR